MLKRSVSLGTCFLAILLAPSEGASQESSKPLDRLRMIGHSPKVTLVSQITSSSHTVTNGETLWGISRKYRVSFSELARLNNLPAKNPVIRIGQELRLPTAKKTAVTKKPASTKKPTSHKSHQVGNGETFYRIARNHGVSVSSLKKANPSINPSALKIGESLRIPNYGKAAPEPPAPKPPKAKPPAKKEAPKAKPPSPIKRSLAPRDRAKLAPKGFGIYTAQSGDTAASIAKQYGISHEEFLRINKKSSYPTYAPRPGEFVMVPTDGSWYVPTPTQGKPQAVSTVNPLVAPPSNPLRGTRRTAPAQPRKNMLVIHEIRANDSLEALAKRFGTTTDQILLDNPGIKGNRDLVVSKTLKIRTRSTL